jgi:hypothetical protein
VLQQEEFAPPAQTQEKVLQQAGQVQTGKPMGRSSPDN